MNAKQLILSTTLAISALSTLSGCQSTEGRRGMSDATGAKPYPLDICLVMDEKLDPKETFSFVHKGQEIKLCCEGCREDFDKEPAKFLKKLAAK